MILLDTNILSELMRIRPDPLVVRWVDARPVESLWVSAITQAEIRLGLALLPDGKRKQLLMTAADAMFRDDFAGRCLSFDANAAEHYSEIISHRRSEGRPISVEDAQIAAIARTNELPLATRNVKDFIGIVELEVIDPWARM